MKTEYTPNSHDALLAACKRAMLETACAFNPTPPDDDGLLLPVCRTTFQHLHNQLKGAIAQDDSFPVIAKLPPAHDQLVAALREIDDMLKGDLPITDAVKQIARNALATAEKGQP